jgi:hypothetical protein
VIAIWIVASLARRSLAESGDSASRRLGASLVSSFQFAVFSFQFQPTLHFAGSILEIPCRALPKSYEGGFLVSCFLLHSPSPKGRVVTFDIRRLSHASRDGVFDIQHYSISPFFFSSSLYVVGEEHQQRAEFVVQY